MLYKDRRHADSSEKSEIYELEISDLIRATGERKLQINTKRPSRWMVLTRTTREQLSIYTSATKSDAIAPSLMNFLLDFVPQIAFAMFYRVSDGLWNPYHVAMG